MKKIGEILDDDVMPALKEASEQTAASAATVENLYVIHDLVLEDDIAIMPFPNDVAAQRYFGDLSVSHQDISKHPEDYLFYRIGRWNKTASQLTPEGKHMVGRAKDYHAENERTRGKAT